MSNADMNETARRRAMDNDDPAVPELLLMDALCLHQRLIEERPEGCGLVESDNTVVSLDFLQGT